jgi:hypothetical protein
MLSDEVRQRTQGIIGGRHGRNHLAAPPLVVRGPISPRPHQILTNS